MNQRTKTKCKRITCLLFALVIIAANAPVSPPAKATAGILPMPAPPSLPFIPHGGDMAYYQNPLVDGYDNADIFALIEATMAAQRAAGVQYVSDLGNGAYVPSEDAIGHMVESVTAVYNALDAVTQSELWQKAENIAEKWLSGAEHIAVSFGKSLLEKVVLKRLDLYPMTNVQTFEGFSLGDVRGMSIFEVYGKNMVYVDNGHFVPWLSDTFTAYGPNGEIIQHDMRFESHYTVNERLYNVPQTAFIKIAIFDNWNAGALSSPTYPALSIGHYAIGRDTGIGWHMYAGSIMNRLQVLTFTLTPQSKTTNDAPEELPAEVTMTLPPAWTAPDFDGAFQRWKAINAMSGADVYSPPIPVPPETDVWDGKAKAIELKDIIWNLWMLLQGLNGLNGLDFDRLLIGLEDLHSSIPEEVTEGDYNKIRTEIEEITDALVNPADLTQTEIDDKAAAVEQAASEVKAGTDAGTDNPAIPDTGTAAGKKLNLTPLMGIAFPEIFPFCLPFDLIHMVRSFNVPGRAPVINMEWVVMGAVIPINIDLSWIESVMPIVRFFLLALFIFSLIKLTPKLIRW